MSLLCPNPQFTFSSMSSRLPLDLFTVVSFDGHEELCGLYEFNILLVSETPDIDVTEVQAHPVVLYIDNSGIPHCYHGVLAELEQANSFGALTFYRAKLVPRLWRTLSNVDSRVFVNVKFEKIIDQTLKACGLQPEADYKLSLSQPHGDEWEFICQYRESHYNFLRRWLEREGAYFYFKQKANKEKVVIVDRMTAHKNLPGRSTLSYAPPSGLDHARRKEIVTRFSCKHALVPHSVSVQDYNYRTPQLKIEEEAQVAQQGRGRFLYYNEHARNPTDAKRLANIRAEEMLRRRRSFTGESNVPNLQAGYRFTLEGHYRKDCNQDYLVTSVQIEASQAGLIADGLSGAMAGHREGLFYRNTFQAIPGDVQFRPQRTTPKPKIRGPLNAVIDAEGSGAYAEVDDQGRYTVKLPFDTSGARPGKASAKLRMAQPYAGAKQGLHMPLLKGTEVILTFVDGDPDRPIIQAAVPNPETHSVVSDANHTKNRVVTTSNNQINIQDQENKESIVANCEKQETWMRLGAPNDPPPPSDSTGWGDTAKSGYFLSTKGNLGTYGLGNYDINIGGLQTTKVFLSALYTEIITGQKTGVVLGRNSAINIWKMEANATVSDKYEGKRFWAGMLRSLLWAKKSWAEGKNTGAAGSQTEAVGSKTEAKGKDTVASGDSTEATGSQTSSTGTETSAQGESQTGVGTESKSVGTEVEAKGTDAPVKGVQSDNRGAEQSNLGAEQASVGAKQKSSGAELTTASTGLETATNHSLV